MPQVPRVSTPTVRTPVTQQPRARVADVSSGTRALASGLTNLTKGLQQFQQQRDRSAAENAMLAFDNEKNEMFFNPNDGYFNTQGRTALDSAEAATRNLDDMVARYSKELNPQAAAMFQSAAAVRVTRDRASILRHASKGQETWMLATSKAQEQNALKNANLYYNNDKELATYLSLGELAIQDRRELVGDEVTARDLESFRSSFISNAINGALSRGDLENANDLMETQGDMLEGSEAVRLNEKLGKEADKQYVNGRVFEIYSAGAPLKDMLAVARQEEDPDRRKEIQRQINNQFTVDERARKDFAEEQVNSWDADISSGKKKTGDVPLDIWEAIGPNGRDSLMRAEEEFVTGEQIITDQARFFDVMSLPPDQLSKVDPLDHYSYLNRTDRTKLTSAILSARGGRKNTETTRIQSTSAIMKSTVEQILGRRIKPEKDAEFVNQIYQVFTDELNAAEDVKGSKLTEAEIRDVGNSFTKKAAIDKSFLGVTWQKDQGIEDVPSQHLDTLASELRTRGMSVSSENIVRLYQASVRAGILE